MHREMKIWVDSQYRNRWNAPGVGWLVRDVVFFDLLNLTGTPRDTYRRRIQEHYRYVFRDTGNACHRACKHEIYLSLSDNISASLETSIFSKRYRSLFDHRQNSFLTKISFNHIFPSKILTFNFKYLAIKLETKILH